MNIRYIDTEHRGLLERDAVLNIVRVRFVPKQRYETIMQAFYNINYFRG